MSLWRLVRRSLIYYWRTNLGVLIAAVVGAAVLAGALFVGDSIRYTLASLVTDRLGSTNLALVSRDRFFATELADRLAAELNTMAAPILQTQGLITNSDDSAHANNVQVLGVDKSFYQIGDAANPFSVQPDEIVLNAALASKLRLTSGDEVVVRMAKPSLMPREVPLTPDSDLSVSFRLKVKAVAGPREFGNFSLRANNLAPMNAFVPLPWLQEKLARAGRANLLLLGRHSDKNISVEQANEAVCKVWQLADTGTELRSLPSNNELELLS